MSADQEFLTLEWMKNSEPKIFATAPAHVHAVFTGLCRIPLPVTSLALPHPSLSIPRLLGCHIPAISTIQPQPPLRSYFHTNVPDAYKLADVISIPIPSPKVINQLLKLAGQAWLDGSQSVSYAHTEETGFYPFWIIYFWDQIAKLTPTIAAWSASDLWLSQKSQDPKSESCRRTADEFRTVLFSLCWGGVVHGFTDSMPIHSLSTFLSRDWLTDEHIGLMLDILQLRISAVPELALRHSICNVFTTSIIRRVYEADGHENYSFESRHRDLWRIGEDLAAGERDSAAMMSYIDTNHWTVLVVDAANHRVEYGNPVKKGIAQTPPPPPPWLIDSITWWLSQHFPNKSFVWGDLPCDPQDDHFSCGIRGGHILRRYYFKDSDFMDPHVDVARMNLGMEIIRRHQQAVCFLVLPMPSREA